MADLRRVFDIPKTERYRARPLYMTVNAVQAKTGLTATVTPATVVLKNIDGDDEEVNAFEVDSDKYSAAVPAGVEVGVWNVSFVTDSAYFFVKEPKLKIKNEKYAGGAFYFQVDAVDRDSNGNVTAYTGNLTFKPFITKEVIPIRPVTIDFDVDVTTRPTGSVVIHSARVQKTCTGISQYVPVTIHGNENATFKISCTGSDGTSNTVPNIVYSLSNQHYIDEESIITGDQIIKTFRIPIPAKSADVTWTITIVPEAGTSNGSAVSAMTLKQQALKTITFTSDNTGISNTSITQKVVTFRHGRNVGVRWRAESDLSNQRYFEYEDVELTVVASSGSLALVGGVKPEISSFSNINNGIDIQNLSCKIVGNNAQIDFKIRATNITANIASAIKIADFLTNG